MMQHVLVPVWLLLLLEPDWFVLITALMLFFILFADDDGEAQGIDHAHTGL